MVERGSWTPGWYPDPMARAPFRWWDGTTWTAGLSDDAVASWADPLWAPLDATPPGPAGRPPSPSAPHPPSVAPPGRAVAWRRAYGAGWVVLALVLCFPLGLLLVWTHPTWKRETRWIATGLVTILVIAAAASDDGKPPEKLATVQPATTVALTTPERVLPTAPRTTTTLPLPTTTAPPTTTLPPTTAPPTTVPPPPTTVAAAPLTSGACHPSYDPCLPITSDVDCASGSGNGPEYTGRVQVIGPDEYDLDRDGDGIGCEDG